MPHFTPAQSPFYCNSIDCNCVTRPASTPPAADPNGDGRYDYAGMNWLPVYSAPTSVRTMDLATALGRNILPKLQDGQLNVNVRDDSMVDYAILNLTILPEPTSATLLALTALPLLRRRR